MMGLYSTQTGGVNLDKEPSFMRSTDTRREELEVAVLDRVSELDPYGAFYLDAGLRSNNPFALRQYFAATVRIQS